MSYIGKVTAGGATHLVGSTLYGTCGTAAATVAKVVTCTNFDTLLEGVTIHVKFTYSNTAASPTLNVNNTGAKPIYRYGTTVPGTTTEASWNPGAVVAFTYDGTGWIMNDWLNNNNTYDLSKYLPLAGGTTTGKVTFNVADTHLKPNNLYNFTGETPPAPGAELRLFQVQYKSADGSLTHTTYPIAVLGNDDGTTNNTGVRLGSINGTTIVGAGESAAKFASVQKKYNDENVYLIADGSVIIYQGLPNDATTYNSLITFPKKSGTVALTSDIPNVKNELSSKIHYVKLSEITSSVAAGVYYSEGSYTGSFGALSDDEYLTCDCKIRVSVGNSRLITSKYFGIKVLNDFSYASSTGTYFITLIVCLESGLATSDLDKVIIDVIVTKCNRG